MDGRHVAVLEAFYGRPFNNPDAAQAVQWQVIYRDIVEGYYAVLMSQSHLKSLYDNTDFDLDPNTLQSTVEDLTPVAVLLQAELLANPEVGKTLLSEFARTLRGFSVEQSGNYLSFRESFLELDPTLGPVIDAGGLPVITRRGQGDFPYSNHVLGTNRSEAVLWDYTQGGDGTVNGYSGNDVLYGSPFNDNLIQELGNGVLVAGAGNDRLAAGAGNDLLDGGTGNDILSGESGSDTYLFRRGSGQDVIIESADDAAATPGNLDTIFLGSGLTAQDINVRRVGHSLTFGISDTSDTLTVRDHFANPQSRIERVQFQDGTVWTEDEILLRLNAPTVGDDIFFGGNGADALVGMAGNDLLVGANGNDTLDGGIGNDVLYGGTASDYLFWHTPDEYYNISRDHWYMAPAIANGDDLYIFGTGYGHDIVVDHDLTPGNLDAIVLTPDIAPGDVRLTRNGNDLVLALEPISGAAAPTDTITVKSWFENESSEWRVEQIRFSDGTTLDVPFIQQTVIVGTPGNDVIAAYSTDDSFEGYAGDDTLSGLGGDDTINGGGGQDTLLGGDGNDTLTGGSGDDGLHGNSGDDLVDGEAGVDRIYGNDGNDVLRGGDGEDFLYGGKGNDDLSGGAGNDILTGGEYVPDFYWQTSAWISSSSNGDDLYRFGPGSGVDVVIDRDITPGNTDRILIDPAIAPDGLLVSRRQDDVVINILGTGDSLILFNWLYNQSSEWMIERVEFGDGTVWDVDTLRRMLAQGTPGNDTIVGYEGIDGIDGLAGDDMLFGREGSDTLQGGSGDDRVYGEAGNDRLFGSEGNDRLIGGAGDDVLAGGAGSDVLYGGIEAHYGIANAPSGSGGSTSAGNDTYIFGRGYGDDTIYEWDIVPGDLDAIEFDASVTPGQIVLRHINGDLRVHFLDSTAGSLIAKRWFDGPEYQIEEFRFADGITWGVEAIRAQALQGTVFADIIQGYDTDDTISGLYGNDSLRGGLGNDHLDGGDGVDTLFGGAGDDVLSGGVGNDSLNGGEGNDVYTYNLGDGQDTISITHLRRKPGYLEPGIRYSGVRRQRGTWW